MATNPLTGQSDVTDPVARVLLAQAMQQRPMYHWAEPLGRLAQFGVGAFIEEDRRKGEEKEMKDWLGAMPGLGTPAAPTVAAPGPTGPRPEAAPSDAAAPAGTPAASPSRDIAASHIPGKPSAPAIPRGAVPGSMPSIDAAKASVATTESGSPQGNYAATGVEVKRPDLVARYPDPADRRAYGKYQVMGFNIPAWTQEVLGRPMTIAEFLANPQAQERVFEEKFGPLMKQHGYEGALRAWFTGSPTGTGSDPHISADEYVRRTRAALPGQQVAQAPGAPAPGAQPVPGATPSMTDITRQPGAIPPEVAAHIRNGLASKNPRVRAAALGLYQQYAAPDKPTDEARNYALYTRQEQAAGRPVMSFFEWDIKRRSAATNQFSVNTPPAEKAADVESAKLAAGRLKDLGDAADAANKMVPAVIRIGGLLDRVQTGKFLPQKITIGQYAKSLGIDVGALGLSGEDLVNAETLRSLMIAQVTSIAKTLGANPTNYDAQLLAQQVANLENTSEGNRQIMKTTRDAIDFARRYETAAANYFKQHRHLHGFAEEFGTKEDERRRKAGLPTFSEPEAAPTAPAAPSAPTAPRTAAPPPPDAQGRRWAEDALGRRYYTPDGGKTWFNSDGTPFQPQGQR